jgi:hypothetical protein
MNSIILKLQATNKQNKVERKRLAEDRTQLSEDK